MAKYVVAFGVGVLGMVFMRRMTNKKRKIYLDVLFIFLNLLVILIQESFNTSVSIEKLVIDPKIVCIEQSVGFLVLLKFADLLWNSLTRAVQCKLSDELDRTYDEWRENTIGILLIMTAINDFLLGWIFEKTEYFTQATILCTLFIGFFIPLNCVIGRHIQREKVDWKENINTIINKWIKSEKWAIICCIIFFMVGDFLLYNLPVDGIIKMLLGIWSAFAAGVFLIIFIDKRLSNKKDK